MTRDEFLRKVSLSDKIKGNYEGTLRMNDYCPTRRAEALDVFTQTAINFYEWAIKRGEKVFVCEDVFRPNGKFHKLGHLVFPDYQLLVRIESEGGISERSNGFKIFLRDWRKKGFIFFISAEDTLDSVIEYFERVKGYYKEKPRFGFTGKIVKPAKKRERLVKKPKYERV